MNNINNEELPDLYMMKDKTVEEISECSGGLDEVAKERILKLCEKKLGISEDTDSNNKIEKSAQVKKYTAPKWHRTAIAAAACLLIVTGIVIVRNNIKTSDQDIKDPVVTSQTEETTQTSVSETTENTQTDENSEYETIADEMALRYQEAENVFTHSGQMRANTDYSDEYLVDGITYYKVSDPRFSSKQDVYDFAKNIYCQTLFDEECSMLIENIFVENDGKLYIRPKEEEKEWPFDSWANFAAEITDVTENTFTAEKSYRENDIVHAVIFNFIQEDGKWKIASSRCNYSNRKNEELDLLVVDAYREFEENNYSLFVEKKSVQDIYKYSDPYLMPEEINGFDNYVVKDIRDKESVYLKLGCIQIGIYNFVNKTYSKITNLKPSQEVRYFSDDYLIIQSYDVNKSTSNPMAPSSSLSYYDIKQNKSTVINENIALTDHDFLLKNNCLYFDAYTRFETEDDKAYAVYKYDFATGELTTVRENAFMPVLINDSVAAIITNPETGIEDTIQVIEGNNNFKYDIEQNCIGLYCVNNQIYELYQEDETFSSVKEIKELKSQNKILSSLPDGRNITISDSNDKFLGLSPGICQTQIPCVYDIKENKIVEFDNLGYNSHNIYVKDNYGVISCYDGIGVYPYKNKIIFFELKDQQ